MDLLARRPRPLRWVVALVAVGVALMAVTVAVVRSGGDEPERRADPPVSVGPTSTTRPPERGGIDVDAPKGSNAVAVPDLGFGIAIPDGWEATVLSADALERLRAAALANEFFLAAAEATSETGAIFYAAGVAESGGVAELKIDRSDDVASDAAALDALAAEVARSGEVTAAEVTRAGSSGRSRVDFQIRQPSAETGEPIDAFGTQLFVADDDRVWSLIVTSEDEALQGELVELFESSLTFG